MGFTLKKYTLYNRAYIGRAKFYCTSVLFLIFCKTSKGFNSKSKSFVSRIENWALYAFSRSTPAGDLYANKF